MAKDSSAPTDLIWALSACNFVIGMGAFIVVGLIDPVADAFTISRAAAGWLMTFYAISYAILSPLLVSATGAIGRRRVLALGMGMFALGAAGCAFAPNLPTLYASRALAAAGAGMFTPVAAAVTAAVSPAAARGRALANVVFGLSLAQVFGVPAGSWVAYTFGWRMAFVMVLVLALIALVVVWLRVPRGLSLQPVSLRDLGRVLKDGLLIAVVLFTAAFLGPIYIIYTYLSPLLTDTMGFGRDGITLVLLIFGIAAVTGNQLGGQMADALGAVKTLVILCLALVFLMPLFSALPFAKLGLFAVVFFWSMSCWAFMASQQIRLLALAPEEASVVFALNAAAIYVGTATGAAVGGLVLEQFGLLALGIAGGIGALGALCHVLWTHRAAKLAGREV